MLSLTLDEAEDILWDENLVAKQDVSDHRWYTKQLVVFTHPKGLMGFYYLEPASEIQEDQDRFEDDPVPIFPVVGRAITTTVYEELSNV